MPSATSSAATAANTPTAAPVSTNVPSATGAPSPTKTRPEDRGLQLTAIQQLNARVGWVVAPGGGPISAEGQASVLFATSDGGANWARLAVPAYARIDRLRFIDERSGWALAFFLRDRPQTGCMQASTAAPCRSVVLTTADGGRTWQERLSVPVDPNGGAEGLRELQAVDARTAWVIARSGPCGHDGCPQQEVRVTTDGGVTWRTAYQVDDRGLVPYLLRTASRDVGWMVAQKLLRRGEVVLGTSDGGRTWRELRETVDAIALDAATERDAWVITRDGAFCSSSERYTPSRRPSTRARVSSHVNTK